MKNLNLSFLGICSFFMFLSSSFNIFSQSLSPTKQWEWKDKSIVINIPEKENGQKSVLGLALPKMEVVRVGFVGLGMRGKGSVNRFTKIPGTEIVALCDYEKERAEYCQKYLRRECMPEADIFYGAEGYKALCERDDIDLVYIATDWKHHFVVAEYAMLHGKNVAIEVPAAMNLEQCWRLIDLSEKMRKHCIMLENCCYDWFEMNTLNMAQQGVFGEIIRVQGAYIHDLDVFWDEYWNNGNDDKLGWRLRYNKENRGDIYATHGLGPVAQVLNIHRGDRMTSLIAMDTESFHGKELVENTTGKKCNDFRNGDHTTTLIRTAKGKVIEIQHNVMTPQPYNRLYQLTGTKGFANKYPVEGYFINPEKKSENGLDPTVDDIYEHEFLSKDEMKEMESKYKHPVLEKYGEMAKEVGGHGGMDFIMDSRMVYCLQNGLPLDMDVYDLAEWCALAELGAISMDNGYISVPFPDFTRGHWNEIKGYKHAFAAPDDEAKVELDALTATLNLKINGMKEWMNKLRKEKRNPTIKELTERNKKLSEQLQLVIEKSSGRLGKKQERSISMAQKILNKSTRLVVETK